MMTREEIAAIDRECEEQHITQQENLESHGIAKHQFYRWKRKYREEDEQSLVPAGFVPMMPGVAPAQSAPSQKTKGKQQKPQDQESFLTVEIRTSSGSGLSGQISGYCPRLPGIGGGRHSCCPLQGTSRILPGQRKVCDGCGLCDPYLSILCRPSPWVW